MGVDPWVPSTEQFVLAHSRIPDRYRNKLLDDMAPEFARWVAKAIQYVDEWGAAWRREQPGVWVVSPQDVGYGKTHLACCLLRGLILTGKIKVQGTYYSFGDLMHSLVAESRGEMEEHDRENLRRLQTSQVMVLDDIDKFTGTSNVVYRLHRIIDDLWGREVPLIITSNAMPEKLRDRLVALGADTVTAASVLSRLRGTCDLWVMDEGPKDYRMQPHG